MKNKIIKLQKSYKNIYILKLAIYMAIDIIYLINIKNLT